MTRFILFFLWLMVAKGYAQGHFILIEEVNRQPFYVRMGEESYSSSSAGHLLLSALKDSSYNLYIGFPRTRYPEQLFNVEIKGSDRGLELRNVNNEWRLFDLQGDLFISPLRSNIYTPGGTRKQDPYSALMAGVVNDTSVLYSTIVNVAPADTTSVKQPKNTSAATSNAVYDKRDIIRYGTENIMEGKLMIYLDRSAPVTDTIRLVIPR